MKFFSRRKHNEELSIKHYYSELDLIPTAFRIPKFIINGIERAELEDRRLLRHIKGLEADNADLRKPETKAEYNLARNDTEVQHFNKQLTLSSLFKVNKCAEVEALGVGKLLESDYKTLSEEYEKYQILYEKEAGSKEKSAGDHSVQGKEANNEGTFN